MFVPGIQNPKYIIRIPEVINMRPFLIHIPPLILPHHRMLVVLPAANSNCFLQLPVFLPSSLMTLTWWSPSLRQTAQSLSGKHAIVALQNDLIVHYSCYFSVICMVENLSILNRWGCKSCWWYVSSRAWLCQNCSTKGYHLQSSSPVRCFRVSPPQIMPLGIRIC